MRIPLLAMVAACSKTGAPSPPPPPAPSPSPAPAQAPAPIAPDAPRALLELLHNVPATVTVSSRVANAAIKPAQLVDGKLDTAWNSRTGDLVGAWIDVEVPHAAATQIRMTVGNTGKGPRGEDYFTMNVRVKRVSLLVGDKVVKTAELDVGNRELQTIDLPFTTSAFRIRIDAITPGTKPDWREVCISELEVMGSGVDYRELVAPQQPKVVVAPPPAATSESLCDEFAAELADFENRKAAAEQANPSTDYGAWRPPSCRIELADSLALSGPWKHVGMRCHRSDSDGNSSECLLALETDGWWLGPNIAGADFSWVDATITAGSDPTLVVRYLANGAKRSIECRPNHTCGAVSAAP